MQSASRVMDQLTPSQSANGVRVFRAYGDVDDPLRLTVLLADHLRAQLPGSEQEVATCRDPKARPAARIKALDDLLYEARRLSEPIAALVDPDALAPADDEGWEDPERKRVRRTFFSAVMTSADRGGWLLVRTNPGSAVTRELTVVDDASPSLPSLPTPALAAFAPECRPAARWLLDRGHLSAKDVERIVATVDSFDDHVIALAYDALPAATRKVARLFGAVRAPLKKNGTFGPFAWEATSTPSGFPRAEVDALRASGFLIADDPARPDDLRVPRRARHLLEAYAMGDAETARAVHARLVFDDFDKRSVEEQLECHFHAVRAGDIARAKQTALFYGVELVALATALSRDKRDYRAAADLFEFVRRQFYAEDPYVWEYWAFNLARWDTAEQQAGRHEADIRRGYVRADELAKHRNPLYRGRLLGHRAERGEDISGDFAKAMAQFLREYVDDGDALSRFADPVLDGARRGHNKVLAAILADWRTCLERVAPRVVAKYGE